MLQSNVLGQSRHHNFYKFTHLYWSDMALNINQLIILNARRVMYLPDDIFIVSRTTRSLYFNYMIF